MMIFDFFTRLEWREPIWLWLGLWPLVPGLLALLRRRRPLSYAEPHLRAWAMGRAGGGSAIGGWLLALAAWLMIGAALAGPRVPATAGAEGPAVDRSGAGVMIALDASRSMDARDVTPDRLERARLEIEDLLERLQGERVGLLVFGDRANLLLPPTRDYALVRHYLPFARNALDSYGTADLGEGLLAAARDLEAAELDGRAVVLVTDGDFSKLQGDALNRTLRAVDGLADRGMPLLVLGVGTGDGDTIPLEGGGLIMEGGKPRVSRMDADTLAALADRGQGTFTRVRDGEGDSEALHQAIAELPSEARLAGDTREWRNLQGLFLVPAILLTLAWLTPVGRRYGLAVVVVGLVGVAAVGPARADETGQRQAFQAFENEDYLQARALYSQMTGFQARFGEGAAAYRRGDFDHAREQFGLALVLAETDSARADALFNLGNAGFRAGNLEQAEAAYLAIIERYRPEDEAAKDNLWLVRQAMGEREMLAAGEDAPDRPGRHEGEIGRFRDPGEMGFPEDEEETEEGLPVTGLEEFGTVRGEIEEMEKPGEEREWELPSRARLSAARKVQDLVEDQPGELVHNLLYHQRPVSEAGEGGP